MDPSACLRRIIDASLNDRDEYIEACDELGTWLRAGGFKPLLPDDMRYIPGTNTPWSVMSPIYASDKWQLVHWAFDGRKLEAYDLED